MCVAVRHHLAGRNGQYMLTGRNLAENLYEVYQDYVSCINVQGGITIVKMSQIRRAIGYC